MYNPEKEAAHEAATKAEALAYDLANASGLATLLSETLSDLDGTIEGQSLWALIALMDRLQKDAKDLSGDLYALSWSMPKEKHTPANTQKDRYVA